MMIPSSPRVMKRAVQVGAATLGLELAVAVLWPAPRQAEFDPSGTYGEGAGPPLRVAALGDSTLTAPGVAGVSDIWVTEVCRRLAQALSRPVWLRSFGAGGATAAQVARAQLPAALETRPELALVSVGANDVIRGVAPWRLARDLDRVVGSLTAAGALVVLSGVGDLGSIPRLVPPLRQVATELGRRADRAHDAVARRHGAIKARQWDWAATEFRRRSDIWSPDRFHPNAAGHRIWAEVCWESMQPLVARMRA